MLGFYEMFSYIQYFPLTQRYGMMQVVNEIDTNDTFFEIANLQNDCITFIINGDWRHCNLNEYTKKLINICNEKIC